MSKEGNELDKILTERGASYGDFGVLSLMAQALKNVLKTQYNYNYLPAEKKEALEMICHKMARIVIGDHNKHDSWIDIAGYAQLVANRLKEPRGIPAPPPLFDARPAPGGVPPSPSLAPSLPCPESPSIGPWNHTEIYGATCSVSIGGEVTAAALAHTAV